MTKQKLLLSISLVCLMVQGMKGQGFNIDPSKPVSAADVKIIADNVAFFDEDSIRIVSTDKADSATAKRRASGLISEGTATTKAGARLFSYTYPSVDADGNAVELSSLLVAPTKMVWNDFAKPNNVVIGCHVTITSNYECPTEYNRSGGLLAWKTDVGMQLYYTRYDFIRQPCCLVIMPDYEGYGVSKSRPHPYLYQELTARQVADAVRYGLALYRENVGKGINFANLEDGWKSVCVGYSQGGSVSLATHRFIEENGLASELHFAGSVCGDGPYDPVEHMLYYVTDKKQTYDGDNETEHIQWTVSMPIVMPLILKGMCDRNPFMRQHKVSDYLTPKFLHTGVIDFINAKSRNQKNKQYSTDDINKAFKDMRKNGLSYHYTDDDGNTTSGKYTADEMKQMLYKESGGNVHGALTEILTQAGLTYFDDLAEDRTPGQDVPTPWTRGVMEDLHRALASNSLVSGWTPTHRIAFYHSTYDTVVPYVNLLSFMRHQDGLSYFFHDKDHKRASAAGVVPSYIVGEDNADIYIMDDNSKHDHVDAGQDFYFWGSPSPDYKLMKWVLKGKK